MASALVCAYYGAPNFWNQEQPPAESTTRRAVQHRAGYHELHPYGHQIEDSAHLAGL